MTREVRRTYFVMAGLFTEAAIAAGGLTD